MDFVVALGWLEGLGIVCHWVGTSQCIVLFEDGARGVVTSVGDQGKSPIIIRQGKDWGRGHGLLQGTKSMVAFCQPCPRSGFVCEVEKWPCHLGVVSDESSVEVAKP